MPWVAIDDQFLVNPKARAVGVHGRALFIASLCWSGMQLNDGTFPASDVQAIAALADVPQTAAGPLTTTGLWHPEGLDCATCRSAGQTAPVPSGHLAIHQYLTYNRSRQQIVADREAAAERKRRSRQKSRSESHVTGDGSHGAGSASPFPSPPNEISVLSSSSDLQGTSPPVDNPDDDEPHIHPPAETWDHYAQLMLDRQPPKSVEKPRPWKTKTAENARIELGAQAGDWWLTFDVTPRRLAEWLIDGQPSRNAQRRTTPPQDPR